MILVKPVKVTEFSQRMGVGIAVQTVLPIVLPIVLTASGDGADLRMNH
jgi:hypothetical protein